MTLEGMINRCGHAKREIDEVLKELASKKASNADLPSREILQMADAANETVAAASALSDYAHMLISPQTGQCAPQSFASVAGPEWQEEYVPAILRMRGGCAPEGSAARSGDEWARSTESESRYPARKRSFLSGAITVFVYAMALVVVVVFVFVLSNAGDNPRTVLGFSVFTILTGSMQRELPQDSLIIVHEIDVADISIGDDITYLRGDNSTVTHRVVGIYENYEGHGRAFQTKGIENAAPDKDVVYGDNVVGKVVFHIPKVGGYIRFLHKNIVISVILCVLILAFAEVIHRLVAAFLSDRSARRQNKPTSRNV